jgi:kumamolisin
MGGFSLCYRRFQFIDNNIKEKHMAETHRRIPGSERQVMPGARVLGHANPNTTIEVTLKLRRKQELPEIAGRPAEQLTRKELSQKYGASEQDIQAVTSAFEKYGLKVEEADAARRTVRVSGPVAAMENAFMVKLFNYAHERGNYRGRVGHVHVPDEIKDGIVQGVFGLDNRRVARERRNPIRNTAHGKVTKIPSSWYKPAELANHYSFPPGDGSGQTVAILEFGGGYFEKDLKAFCTLAGVSMPTVKTVSVDGTSTSAKDGAEGEVMLDVEVVAGVCPKSTIAVYFAQFSEQGWIENLDAAVHDDQNDPGVISVSWGFAEDAFIWTTQAMQQVNESLKEAALLGITVCIAAGDDGSSDGIQDGHTHADFPASSPFVLAVGGTTIPKKGAHQSDIVWKEGDGLRNDGGGSTGGAISKVFPRPAWQSKIGIKPVDPGALVGRCIPDVAANADWDASPYLLVVDGKAEPNGGTSAAAPLWAALIALINSKLGAGKRVGYLTPELYQPAGAATVGSLGCTDVNAGNNNTATIGGYSARAGYDAVSGWGVPNGTKLLAALTGGSASKAAS